MVAQDREPKVRGAVIKDARDWMRTAYGADAYRSALNKLAHEERAFVDGPLLAGSWYPLDAWDRFQTAMRAEALARRGESDHEFNLRNMRNAGSTTVRAIYKFVLGLMSPQSVISRAPIIYGRAYSEGRCDVVENVPGTAVLRYSECSPAFRMNLTNNFPCGIQFLLELNGAAGVDMRISRDEVMQDGKLVFEVTATYDR